MYVNLCSEIDEVNVGDIVAVVGFKGIIIGDILIVEKVFEIVLERMVFFELVIL